MCDWRNESLSWSREQDTISLARSSLLRQSHVCDAFNWTFPIIEIANCPPATPMRLPLRQLSFSFSHANACFLAQSSQKQNINKSERRFEICTTTTTTLTGSSQWISRDEAVSSVQQHSPRLITDGIMTLNYRWLIILPWLNKALFERGSSTFDMRLKEFQLKICTMAGLGHFQPASRVKRRWESNKIVQ